MRFDIRFVDHPQPEFVGQLQEYRVVRVVGRADRVEAELLHLHDVCAHRVSRDDTAGALVEVVPVDAAYQDALAV